jgi:hypothetical protein
VRRGGVGFICTGAASARIELNPTAGAIPVRLGRTTNLLRTLPQPGPLSVQRLRRADVLVLAHGLPPLCLSVSPRIMNSARHPPSRTVVVPARTLSPPLRLRVLRRMAGHFRADVLVVTPPTYLVPVLGPQPASHTENVRGGGHTEFCEGSSVWRRRKVPPAIMQGIDGKRR